MEEIRRYLENKYGSDQVHEGGLRVYTSLDMDLQKVANQAVLDGVAAYERRHGWKESPVKRAFRGHAAWTSTSTPIGMMSRRSRLHSRPGHRGFSRHRRPSNSAVTAPVSPGEAAWTRKKTSGHPEARRHLLREGAKPGPRRHGAVSLEQDSGAQGALVAIDNATGEIKAMVGGRDFNESKFNRATQALRQVGSSFKPYVYTAVIDQGGSPDDTVLDAPITFETAIRPVHSA